MPDNVFNGNDETKLSDEQAFANIKGISKGDVTPRHLLQNLIYLWSQLCIL
jgi:hypothetical protein